MLTHNCAESYTFKDDSPCLAARVFCEEHCLLYSGDLDVGKSLAASGTVFRSVLIWSTVNGTVLQRYLGHTGVIFDTKFLSCGRVASVCDDRSVRVWKD